MNKKIGLGIAALFFFLITSVYAADTTPPTGSIKINNGATYTNSTSVTLNLSATDTGSGVSQMKFSVDRRTWLEPEPYNTIKSFVLTAGDGRKTVYVKFKDNAGNWSKKSYSDTITLDTTAPTGSILINKNASSTNFTQVSLKLSAKDKGSKVSQMQFSNNNLTWSEPEVYAKMKTWTLSPGSGTKTVYVKFKDEAGNWSSVYSDSIVLDTTSPLISNVTATDITANSASVSWNTDEPASGQVEYGLTISYGYKTSLSRSLVTSRSITIKNLKEYTLYHYRAISKDSLNNQSVSDDYTFTTTDATPPTGSITINNGANYTNTTSVTLTLSATDTGSGLSQMQFSNNNSTWSAAQAYATTKTWTLTTGDGTKTVYVKFKDVAGHWSPAYSDTIILDTTTPSTPIVTDDGVTTPSSTTLHCRWSSTDSISGISEYQYKITQDSTSGLTIVDWTSVGTDTEVTKTGLSLTDNKTYYFSVKAKNGAGLWSGVGYSDGIKVVITQILSISVTPKFWNIGSTEINRVITMAPANKITVTNDGSGPETFELKLTNPSGWTASTVPGEERYVLSGLFCNAGDIPQASHFNQDAISEDIITTNSIKATQTIFAYAQATANGVAVPSGGIRSLYLQFKSPTVTQKKEEQNISVIVSCQIP